MNGSTRAAMALSVGYVLGRRKKLRTAAMLAAATAVGSKGVGGLALQRGMKMLGSTETFGKLAPQLSEITDTVRGDLLPAGKAAAGAAVSSRFDSLTGSLHDRAERLRNPGETVAAGAEGAKKTAGRTAKAASGVGRPASRRGAAAPDDEHADDEYENENGDLERDDYDYEDSEPADEYENGEPDEDEDGESETPRRGPARRRSPVSRTRR